MLSKYSRFYGNEHLIRETGCPQSGEYSEGVYRAGAPTLLVIFSFISCATDSKAVTALFFETLHSGTCFYNKAFTESAHLKRQRRITAAKVTHLRVSRSPAPPRSSRESRPEELGGVSEGPLCRRVTLSTTARCI